jgi:curli biogenesis system outer membrane secretion channel CsgG
MPAPSVRTRWFPAILAGFVLAALAASAPADDTPKGSTKPVVLVPPFENHAKQHEYIMYDVPDGTSPKKPRRQYRIDRYTEAPRTLFEDALANIGGVTVVERKRLDALLVEAEFNGFREAETERALKLGKLLGANRIIIGTIADISEETKEFKGYNIVLKKTVVTAELTVRMIDIDTGEIGFSKTVKGSQTYEKSNNAENKSSDRHFAAVKAAVAELAKDDKFKAAVQGKKSATEEGLIEVEFAPKPDNCDVEIDGKYVGGSPVKRKLKAGTEYKVRISKAGYKEWTGVITPEAGLKITREMEANK